VAGRQHDRGFIVLGGEPGGYVEAVDVWELNVEQRDGRAYRGCRGES
jgi:hypothetical protein